MPENSNPFDQFDTAQTTPVESAKDNPFNYFDPPTDPEAEFLKREEPQSYVEATGAGAIKSAIKGAGGALKGAAAVAETMPLTGGSFYNPPVWARPESDPTAREQLRRQELLGKPAELMAAIQADPLFQAGKAVEKTGETYFQVEPSREKQLGPKVGEAAGSFVPLIASGPAAPATIGLQSLGDGLENHYNEEIAKGKSSEEAAKSAINRSIASGAAQSALFAFLPEPLRKAGDKLLIDKFAKGVLSRFLLKRVAQAGEGAVLGAASRGAENVIEGRPVTEGTASSAAGLGAIQALMPRGPSPDEALFKAPPEGNPFDYFTPQQPETRNLPAPVNPSVPIEPGPIGVIPPGGTVPVPRGRIRLTLPTTQPTGGQNAPQTRQEQKANISEYTGIPQRGDVRTDETQVRQGASGQTGGGGGAVEGAGEEKATPIPSPVTDARAKLFENMGGRTMELQPGAFDTADAHLKRVLGANAPTWQQLQEAGIVEATPIKGGGVAVKVKTAPDPNWDVRVQAPQTMPDGKTVVPGFVQIGDAVGNTWSSNPDALRKLGYDIPDLSALPQGKYKMSEAVSKATAAAPEKAPEPPTTVTQIDPATQFPVEETDVDPKTLKLSSDVPNFKSGANEKGVVPGEEIQGKYTRIGTGRTVVWERKNGDREIITGRHRWNKALEDGVKNFPVQIVREADGFTKDMALVFDAEANIRDGQGSIYDYATYFRNTRKVYDEKSATERGLLSRAKGRTGWDIAKNAGDDLYAAFANGKITAEQADAIANAAPSNVAAQRVGIRAALAGATGEKITSLIGRALLETGVTPDEMDLFGNSDAALNKSIADEAKAQVKRDEITDQIRAVQSAARNPKQARKLGVDVKDPQGVIKKIAQLKELRERWNRWWADENKDLAKQIGVEVVKSKPPEKPTLKLAEPESVEQQNARVAAEKAAAEKKAAEEKAKAELTAAANKRMGGDMGSAGQGGLFDEPGQQEIFQTKPAEAKPAEPNLTESQKEIVSAVQKYRIKDQKNSPRTYTIVERLPQTDLEKEAGDPVAVKVKDDQTGEVQTVYENQLKPVRTRTAEERAASKPLTKAQMDDMIRKEGADPKDFPDKAAKREFLKRKGKLSKREIAEGIAEKLEQKKIKNKGDKSYATLFPILDDTTIRSVWNTAIDIAQNAIRAGGSIADGIERAIEYIRANVKSDWDENGVRRELEISIGPVGESERHQVAGVRRLGEEYEPENIRAIQSRLRVSYFDGTQPVEQGRTDQAWDIANRMAGENKGSFAEQVRDNADANMAPGLLVKELWDYAVKMAANKDDSLLRFIVNRYADLETGAGGGSFSKAGQVLRSARELASNPLWQALVRMETEAAKSAERRLAVGPELFNDIISRINEISLTAEEIDNVLREGRDSEGRTLREILDANSPERAAAGDALEQYSPQVKNTAFATVYEWLKENSGADERTFVDGLTRALVDLRNPDLDEATARQIAEGTWTRKNTIDTARRRSAWDKVLKELDNRSQATAQGFLNQLERSQTEWQKIPERRNEALKIIREAMDPKTPLPAQTPSLFKIPLRDRLMALGVSRETASGLADQIYFKRMGDWSAARIEMMQRAASSKSVKSLVEALRTSPYRAQKDPAWRQRTAEDWFMSNGLSRDQAQTAARLFSAEFERALQTAGEKLATKLLNGKPPRTVADVIKAIRAGLTDPNRNWVDDIAALNNWKGLTVEQNVALADIDAKLANPELSLPEQSELFDQMNSIVQRAGDGSKRWKYAVGELFAANKLSHVRTTTLHIFQPISSILVKELPVALTYHWGKDFGTNLRALAEAAKNFFPELKYAWQKDVYYLSQSKMISYHNELRNRFNEGIQELRDGKIRGAFKVLYAFPQYVLRALQSANQANQALLREWKLTLYGSRAMRDAGMSSGEISRIVDEISESKQAAYEDGINRGMSKAAAAARADDLTFQHMRKYFGEKLPGGLEDTSGEILRAAENDQYSAVGRMTAENSGKEEGWYLSYFPNKIINWSNELRREGGFKSVVGLLTFGFANIPLRTARFLSNFTGYGFVRYGRYRLGQKYNWENPWKQAYGTELQAKQRLREAIVSTALGIAGLALFHTTADPDRKKRVVGIYVSGAWKSIRSKVERDALDKEGFKPLSMHLVVDGKVRAVIPMTRTGHALGFLFGMSSIADDIAWKNKEAIAAGKEEPPITADALTALGTMYYIVGQQGVLQSVSYFQNLAQGTTGGSAIERSIADIGSNTVGGFEPMQGFLQDATEFAAGARDKTSITSDIAANLPVLGAAWQQKALNRLGDPLYDQTWYGKTVRLGAPFAFKIAQTPENQNIYGMMVDKGVVPPDLRRTIIEDKYGPLTDDQWSQYVRTSGGLLKTQILDNLAGLKEQDPKEVKLFLNKAGASANNEAAATMGMEPQPKAAGRAGTSGGISMSSGGSGAAVGPAALRGLPKSTGIPRKRRISLGRSRSTGAPRIKIGKLRVSSRRVATGRLSRIKLASGKGRRNRISIGGRQRISV